MLDYVKFVLTSTLNYYKNLKKFELETKIVFYY